jgi:hypothetical protein
MPIYRICRSWRNSLSCTKCATPIVETSESFTGLPTDKLSRKDGRGGHLQIKSNAGLENGKGKL